MKRRLIVSAICFMLVGCQAQGPEEAAPFEGGVSQQPPSAGWTIEDTMMVRKVDHVRISPDGRKVLFAVTAAVLSGDKGEYFTQVYTANADGTREQPLTPADYSATGAEWSPDGRWIAFLADPSGESDGNTIWLVPAEGGRPWPIKVGGAGVADLKWSPDGSRIAFTMPASATPAQVEANGHPDAPQLVDASIRSNRLWLVGIAQDGTALGSGRVISGDTVDVGTEPYLGSSFDWSPDGSRIVFAYGRSSIWEDWPSTGIALVDVGDGKTTPLVSSGATAPAFSPDGRSVAYLSAAGRYPSQNIDVFVVDSRSGQPRKLAETLSRSPTLVGWSADGDDVLVSEPRRTFTRLSAVPISGAPARDIDPGGAVLGEFTLDRSRAAVAFTRQTLTEPVEAWMAHLDGFDPVQVSHANAALAAAPLPRTDLIHWTSSGGAEIEGLLTYPAHYQPDRRYPLVVLVHSGGHAFQQAFVASPFESSPNDYYPVTEWALHGYVVLQSNSRGGGLPGYGHEYSLPEARVKDKAYQDVMTAVDRVVQMGVADSGRVGIAGFSNGALVASWVITQTPRFKAAVINAGFPDLVAAASTMGSWISDDLGVEPWENPLRFAEYSPLMHLEGVTTPTLILHGESDDAVPIAQGYGLYRALKRRGVPTEMVVYPGGRHGANAPKHVMDMGKRQVAWMERYLR